MIYYFEKDPLARMALEVACKAAGLELFTQPEVCSCEYYFTDMPPKLLIVDLVTQNESSELITDQVQRYLTSEIPVWFVGFPEGELDERIPNDFGVRKSKPLMMMEFVAELTHVCK
jgi:hypothetical protein